MMWSMIPCRPAMTFWSIVGHASFQTADTMGPSTSERSYLEGLITMKAVLFVLVIVSLPASASADDGKDRLCGTWAINAWGLSYHVKQNGDYSDANVGAGVRCYARPHWWIPGRSRDNRLLAVLLQVPSSVSTGKAYRVEKIADGVYYATATGSMVTGSNNVVIIGSRDVLVVDTGTSPAAARAFIQDLKLLTPKPVRYVVNTHFHYDHTDGNQVYAGKADIIAHDYVKYAIDNLNVLQREPFKTSQLTNVPLRIDTLKKQIADEKDAGRRIALQQQLNVAQKGWVKMKVSKY